MKVIGVMSGTSVDSIDIAVCEFRPCLEARAGWTMDFVGYRERPFPPERRRRVLDLLRRPVVPLDDLTELNFILGTVFADAVLDAIADLGLDPRNIDLIASHGQTIYHLVEPDRCRSTLQMGEPAVIAFRTGCTVVGDFRVADVAAGGEGAPLVSFFDAVFFGGSPTTRAIQNIGGIANVTFLPARSGSDAAYAFDTGPGNALMDYAANHLSQGTEACDRDGAMAARGRIHDGLLEEVLGHPYFSRTPPKSTGRELFGDNFAAALVAQAKALGLTAEDTMATLTAITAESIARAYRCFGPVSIDEAVLSGGGAHNPALVNQLHQRLPGITFRHLDDFGLPADAKEAVAFAVLGYEALHGRSAHLPHCTGAARSAILGKIVPGDNYCELMQQVFGGRKQGPEGRGA